MEGGDEQLGKAQAEETALRSNFQVSCSSGLWFVSSVFLINPSLTCLLHF